MIVQPQSSVHNEIPARSRPSVFSRRIFERIAWLAGVLSVVFILVNLFVIGGDAFVISISDILPIPLSILTTISSFVMWRKFVPRSGGTTMWGWLVIGWGMWAVGETLYFVLSQTSSEIPYPSAADYFYIAGYFPFALGLISRLRETPRRLTSRQQFRVFVSYTVLIAAAFTFVIQPVLRNSDPSTFYVTVLDMTYAIGDILVLLLAIRLLVDYRMRVSSSGWVLLIIGFIMMTIADLMYSYLISFDLYNPGGKANLITSLGNSIPYGLAYIFYIMGIYRLQVRQDNVLPMPEINLPKLVENAHILFFLKKDYSVDSVSFNFSRVFTNLQPVGCDFFNMLGIRKAAKLAMVNALTSDSKFADLELVVNTSKKDLIVVKTCGISTTDPKRNFDGVVIVMRLLTGTNDMDGNLTDYQLSIVRHVRAKSGSTEETAICDFLCGYYYPLFKRLEAMVYQNGGAQQGVVFIEYLNQTAARKGLVLHIGNDGLERGSANEPFQLLKELSNLMNVGREYLGRIADAKEIDMELERVKAMFGNPVNQNYRYIKAAFRVQTGSLTSSSLQ